jgi:hypothetical protein
MRPHRPLVATSALLTLSLALSSAVALAQADVDPTAEEVAIAAMLQAGDVHRSATSQGLRIVTAEDLPGYTANGGLREVRQTWNAEGGPAEIVFDFRWQFPDADSAAAFLDAAEEVLSEVSTGAESQSLPRRQRPLPDTRLYTFADTIFGTGTVGFNYLMRHENLVAKVYVSGEEDQLSRDRATEIARAAAQRMEAALEGAPAPSFEIIEPSPPPSPAPSPAVDQSPLPDGSPSPSPVVVGSPGASPAAGDPLAELLSHVPAAVRESCGEDPTTDQVPVGSGQSAQVTCTPSDGGVVAFVLFESVEAMDAAYETAGDFSRLFGSFSTSATCEAGGYDGTWSLADVEVGRLLCLRLQGEAWIVWSHPDTRILSIIQQAGADHAAAWELWLQAGPE